MRRFFSLFEIDEGCEVFVDPFEISSIECHKKNCMQILLKNGRMYKTELCIETLSEKLKDLAIHLKVNRRH